MIPHEKEMVEKFKDKPFALLGINSDGDRSVVQNILKDNEITWRNAIDGSTSGPLATAWNVHGWPTIYVIDAKGIIRARNLRDKDLESKVDELLAEIGR
jgi:hypothetical protein